MAIMIQVKKSTGKYQDYSENKLINSLRFSGASEGQIDKIIEAINQEVYDGVTTRKIFSLAFKKLREISRPLSAYYGTKRALLELGPDGYVFEKYVARIMEFLDYETLTNIVVEGNCVEHEVDVIAKNDSEKILIECKFHQSSDRRNDLKTVLYVKARATDILTGPNEGHFTDMWLVSNTSFSDDAIRYATCAGLRLWGANFPPQNTLQDIIRDKHLDPITCLSALRKAEKRMLLESGVLLIKEISDNPQILKDIGLTSSRCKRVLHEIKKLQ